MSHMRWETRHKTCLTWDERQKRWRQRARHVLCLSSHVTCLMSLISCSCLARCLHLFFRYTWLNYVWVCDITHSCVSMWHDSFMCEYVTWLIHVWVCDMTHSCVTMRHDSRTYEYLTVSKRYDSLWVSSWPDSFVCEYATWLIHMWEDATWLAHVCVCDITYSCVSKWHE